MSDMPDIEPDDDMLAAEYALRLLEGDELVAFEARLRREPDLIARVAAWNERLSALGGEVDPVTPPSALKPRLEIALFGSPDRPVPWLATLSFWRGLSFASLAAVAALAFLMLRPAAPPPAPGPIYTAEIAAEDASLRLIAVYDEASGLLRLSRTVGGPLQGRVLELWAIAGGQPPLSLGVLPDATTATVALPDQLQPPPDGAVLAISDEPVGGSPTGQPTGAVLALGEITPI